jgi:ribosomal protein S18 acetylase RimI-like enzyme
VHPDFRREGYGEALMEEVEARARQAQARAICSCSRRAPRSGSSSAATILRR